MAKETYKGLINEFVDWISGINSLTGSSTPGISENTPVSGLSIRLLLLEHLKVPFVTNDSDKTKDKIYFFSSVEAKNLWEYYSKKGSVQYDEEKANSLVLYSMDLPATYTIIGLESFSTRYIIEGNSSSENAVLAYTLDLRDSLGTSDSDEITVTYKITDDSQNLNYNESIQISTGVLVRKNIYLYLKSGDNKVEIIALANNHSARITKTFHIYLVSFSISSNFTGYYSGLSNGIPFSFDVSISRSITNLPVTIKIFVDNIIDENNPAYTWTYTESLANPSKHIELQNNYLPSDYNDNITHTLVIRGTMKDLENGNEFNSNVLLYEFLVQSSLGDLANAFVNYTYSVPYSSYAPINELNKAIILSTLYVPFSLNWGYYSDNGAQQANISWLIRKGIEGEYLYTNLVDILGIKGVQPENLTFVVSEQLSYETDNSFLVAKIGDLIISEFPINVLENNITISEKENYSLKLSAYGKTNQSATKDEWTDQLNNITTTFVGVPFDNNNGWNDNSLVLKGTGKYALINYCPFPSTYNNTEYRISRYGATFEIDFKPEYVSSNDDILMSIGNVSGAHIEIKPNSAAYYENGSAIVKTNYKSGERIKLAFIFNRGIDYNSTNSADLVYIINNGILERAGSKGSANVIDDASKIKIGDCNSSIRVYMIRAYRHDLSPKQALDNYMFDNISDANLISRNDIYGNSSSVTYNGVQGKQDIITIEGDLTDILRNASQKENATVTIRRQSNTLSDKDFTVVNCRIRNHGQSTLSYPITSMKFWLNKSNKFQELIGQNGNVSLVEITPTFTCLSQSYLGLNKNRYIMKDGSIPSNKFVLQANYADSSGSHNGSLLRLIQDTWYNAKFGDNNEFKLRTAPQLFTSGMRITHNDPNLNEDGSWEEGVCNISGSVYEGRTWPEIAHTEFPYTIRNSADSFPCTVFYKDTSIGDNTFQLLGQYVFMDDKKSDYVYGERSIYFTDDPSDPFCLRTVNSKKDKNVNKVWDNSNVLQIEVVYPNSPLTSYVEKLIADEYTIDENTLILTPTGNVRRYDTPIEYDLNNRVTKYLWEQHFELIYPDKDDIVDDNKNFSPEKFAQTILPFTAFLEWITDVGALRNTGNKLGDSGSQSKVTLAELNKFIAEAHDHLDLYKLAAYYIFFLRFGLVDSVERNALLKTYDGQHWHYEPWDMDIALGCANNGVIAYDPPIDRNTTVGGTNTYAFSGRTSTQSNVLWDCLECWEYWSKTIVPEVAEALYNAGLTYTNASKMFDEEYVLKWSETLYNESGQYKYIDATSDGTYRKYLNGARTSHRHWWLSTSMNYYDAKWDCGDFTKHAIEFRINKENNSTNTNTIRIYPTNNTFFKAQYASKGDSTYFPIGELTEATTAVGGEAVLDFSVAINEKQPCFIFGANSIELLDLSHLLAGTVGSGYTDLKLNGSYDEVLGARLRVLKVGAPCTPSIYDYPGLNLYTSNLTTGQNAIIGITTDGHDALENLEFVDVNGWYCKLDNLVDGQWLSKLVSGRKNIHTLYALGCNSATEFKSSEEGNKFLDLKLPTSVRTLQFTNSSWENLTFWETTDLTATSARYDKVDIPSTVETIILRGTTARNECSLELVLDWINSIEASLPVSHTEEDLLAELANYTIEAEQINWGTGNSRVYYRDLIRLSSFNKGGKIRNLTGYVVISDVERLTAVQLAKLEELFGENVFNIGTTNSNLVVDLNQGFVRISTNAILDVELNKLSANEPDTIRINATKFTLSSNQYDNYIIGTERTLEWFELNTPENVYLWGIQETSTSSTVEGTYKSAVLRKLATGNVVLDLHEGDFGNYSLFLKVYYYDADTSSIKSDIVEIYVKGVTYPSSIGFSTAGNSVRSFKYNRDIALDIFGNLFVSTYSNNNFPDTYIMYSRNHKTEFYLNLGAPESYTATLKSVKYYLTSLENSLWNSGQIDKSELTGGSNEITSIEIGSNNQLGYSHDATNGGINVCINGDAPSTMKKYMLYAIVEIGGRSLLTIGVCIITYNDSNIIVTKNNSNALYRVLKNFYNSCYPNLSWENSIYKSDLMSLYGTLDFHNDPTTTLLGNNGVSILAYTPYISEINLNSCSSLPYMDLVTSELHLNLSNILNLLTILLNGCIGMNGNVLDLSLHTETLSVDIRNTSLGIIIPENSQISSLLLGEPVSISITRPMTLTHGLVSILSNQNLTSLELVGVNKSDLVGYNMFNVIL